MHVYLNLFSISERDALIEGKEKFMTGTTDAVVHDGLISSIFNRQNICSAGETCGLSNSVNDLKYSESQQRADLILSKHSKLGFIEPVTLDLGGQLPDDSSSLFDFTSLQKNSSSDQLHLQGDDKAHSVDVLPPDPEDLSLFYLDPQGEIQGPYMGIDIIMWFEQGYFGTDLPVRLSDAPAGSPFQELGEIMPHLKFKAASAPGTNLTATSQLSDAVGGTLEDSLAPSVSGSDFKGSAIANDQQWVSTAASSINYYSRVPNNENKSELHYADDKNFQNSVAQDEGMLHGLNFLLIFIIVSDCYATSSAYVYMLQKLSSLGGLQVAVEINLGNLLVIFTVLYRVLLAIIPLLMNFLKLPCLNIRMMINCILLAF